MPKLKGLLVALAALALVAGPLSAQSAQKFSIQGSFFSSTLFGNDVILKNVDPGAGFEVQLRYTPSAFSLGLGFQWTTHNQNLFSGTPGIVGDPNTTLNGIFIEPRYVIAIRSNTVAPYVSARVSGVEQKTTFLIQSGNQSTTIQGKAYGLNVNGGGGFLFRASSRVNFDLGATVGYTKFGDFKTSQDGTEVARRATSGGGNLAVRFGIAVGL